MKERIQNSNRSNQKRQEIQQLVQQILWHIVWTAGSTPPKGSRTIRGNALLSPQFCPGNRTTIWLHGKHC